MKGARVVGSPLVRVVRFKNKRTTDGLPFLELELEPVPDPAQRMAESLDLPTFRAWHPFSRKSVAELAVMGIRRAPSGLLYRKKRTFVVDLIAVECSDEETHGTAANRYFVRNARPKKG